MSIGVGLSVGTELTGARVLTNSRLNTLRQCQRLHYYKYMLGVRPVGRTLPLRFGSLIHAGLEAWSKAKHGEPQLEAALAALDAAIAKARQANEPFDEFDVVRARVLMTGYHYRWADDDLDWIAVEQPFSIPLRNPATGRLSPLWEVRGKMDGITRRRSTGEVLVAERKTSSEDIGVGSPYWSVLTLDGQVSIYLDAARQLGHDARGVLYDVVGKPGLQPYKATPPEKQKRKADGTLYANQRERDETPAEFEARLVEHVAEQPDRYFRRGKVVRFEDEVEEGRFDVWQLAQQLRESERAGRFPRNTTACRRFNKLCEFFPVCSRQASIDDETMYRRVSSLHPELDDEE